MASEHAAGADPGDPGDPEEADDSGAEQPFGDVDARLTALEAQPDFALWMAHEPGAGESRARSLGGLFGLVVLIGLGIVFLVGLLPVTLAFLPACPPLGFAPLIVLGFALFATVRQILDTVRGEASAERQPALVVEARTGVAGHGGQSQALRRHRYVTLQLAGGRRREVRAVEATASGIRPGDVGVAYLRRGLLLEFRRAPV